eukprot:Seg1487.9 transcript_id=Seg1487.9/GoldUCD/mRNA.D3Y31 product="hypothetical protein" protein_id=Seg1487.9/GoldUCD/D3Y31
MDATYKTMRYAMPLFFLCVRTNVNYEVVAAFIIQNETTAEIEKALSIIRDWNKNWTPNYFMCDCDEKEINAIETIFKDHDCFVYLCDFHREQAWTRWVSKTEHGVTRVKDEVLCRLRRLAKADTEANRQALYQLRSSTIWKDHEKLRSWMEGTWLPQFKRWVWAYRANTFQVLVKTNNGIERQNKLLKHNYLRRKRKLTISSYAQSWWKISFQVALKSTLI